MILTHQDLRPKCSENWHFASFLGPIHTNIFTNVSHCDAAEASTCHIFFHLLRLYYYAWNYGICMSLIPFLKKKCVCDVIIENEKVLKINISQKTGTNTSWKGKHQHYMVSEHSIRTYKQFIKKNVNWSEWKCIHVHFAERVNLMTSQLFKIVITPVTIFLKKCAQIAYYI